MKVGVVIPAYNEADRIRQTIRAVRTLPEIVEIVVVDDGSDDETASLALREGVRVVWHQHNYGKGQALKSGIQSIQSDILLFVDADMGEQASELSSLLKPILAGQTDLAIAVFPPAKGKQGFGLVKGLARWGIHRLTGFTPLAPLSGQRAVTKEAIRHISLADGYGVEVGMTVDVLLAGYRVAEIPVAMQNREYGRTLRGFLHRGRQFLHIARVLLERWTGRKHPAGELQDGMEMKE
jgi:glycosyltransferase involved in cell wall biosynthesis